MSVFKSSRLYVILFVLLAYGVYEIYASNNSTATGATRYNVKKVNRTQISDTSGNFTLVTGVTGKKIQIWGCTLATAGTTMEFKSASTTLTGAMPLNAIQIDVPVFDNATTDSAIPWLESINTGDGIVLVLSGAVQVSGQVIWTSN